MFRKYKNFYDFNKHPVNSYYNILKSKYISDITNKIHYSKSRNKCWAIFYSSKSDNYSRS